MKKINYLIRKVHFFPCEDVSKIKIEQLVNIKREERLHFSAFLKKRKDTRKIQSTL